MDPAEPHNRFERIENALMQHEQRMEEAAAYARRAAETNANAFAALSAQLQQLMSTRPPAVPGPVPEPPAPALPQPRMFSEPRVGAPERYNGNPELCGPFLTSCSLLFSLQPYTFATEEARVAYVISNLTGRALLWGTAEWERRTSACASFQAFSEELRKVFGLGASGSDAARDLLSLHQGNQSVADFSIDFRTRARQSDWNTAALRDAFLHGLADYIKDELVSYPLPSTLDELIELTVRLDLRIRARRRERRQNAPGRLDSARWPGPSSVSSPPPPVTDYGVGPEPMQVGRTKLSLEERERRRKGNLCMYCGQAGHYISRCPLKDRAHQ